MSQNVSINSTVDQPVADDLSLEAQAANDAAIASVSLATTPFARLETEASHLMDDLFQDLDRALEGRGQLSEATLAPRKESEASSAALATVTDAPITTPDEAIAQSEPASAQPALAEAPTEAPARPRFGVLFDRLLLAAACVSVIAASAVWLVLSQTRFQQEASVPMASAPTSLQANPDPGFFSYVQRSLEAIDRRTEAQRQVASASGSAAGRGLPEVAVSAGPGSPSVMERVYVPLYQPPAVATYGNTVPALPSISTMPLPSLAPAPAAPPNIAATTGTHVLVGVLELGDRSAALFEVNGTTQRINMGERIGTSGWTLVSVSNQEAIVRRNGEVRSVYIGQQF